MRYFFRNGVSCACLNSSSNGMSYFFSDFGLCQNAIIFQELGISCLLEFKQLRDALIFFLAKFFSEFGLCQNEIFFQERGILCLLEFKQLLDALFFFFGPFFSEFGLCQNEIIFQEPGISCLPEFKKLMDALFQAAVDCPIFYAYFFL